MEMSTARTGLELYECEVYSSTVVGCDRCGDGSRAQISLVMVSVSDN